MMTKRLLLAIAFLLTLSCFQASASESAGNPTVIIHTSMGNITLELDQTKAPITVANFLEYANEGFYNGTIFHRVINNFMVQGGGFDETFTQKKTKAQIKNEADNGLKNNRGTIAMARTPNPHSASSQFFINHNDNHFLNYRNQTQNGWGYAVFGKVTKGMEVVDNIAKVRTGDRGQHGDVPVNNVVIKSVEVVK